MPTFDGYCLQKLCVPKVRLCVFRTSGLENGVGSRLVGKKRYIMGYTIMTVHCQSKTQ